jgi:hypothetical protein
MATLGNKPHHASCVAGTGQGPCQHTYTCECRTTLSGSGKSQTEHNTAARAVLQCPHRMLWPRSGSLWAATARDEARQGHNRHMHTRGLRQTHRSTRIREPADVQPPDHLTMAIDARQVASAHGDCKPQPGDGTVQCHRVPAHRTPSDVVAGLGVQCIPMKRYVHFDCSPSANRRRIDRAGKISRRRWRLL